MKESRLPKGWIEVPLAEVGTWVGGGTPSKAEPRYWTNGSVPWVSPKDMKQATLHDAEDRITTLAVRESATQIVPAGSVLAVTRSGILRHTFPVAINAVPVALNQDLKAIIPHDGFDASYLAWVLRESERRILHECSKSGTTVQSVETSKLQAFRVPVAPPAEQRRIVAALEEYLSDLDAAISALERTRANLNRYRRAVLQAAVSECSTEMVLFGELLDSLRNGISTKPEGDSGLRILRISAVRPLRVDLQDVRFLPSNLIGEYRGYILEEGDLLFTRYNGNPTLVGACGAVGTVPEPTVYPDKLIRARVKRDRINPRFAQIAMSVGVSWEFIQSKVKTTAGQAGIAGGDLKLVPVPLPPMQRQASIITDVEDRLNAANRTAAEIDIQLASSGRLRQSVLKRAFEGRLVQQNPNDEPASVLFDRVHTKRGVSPARAASSRRSYVTHR